jgi:tetratricopeptide (TPR) repeat protein
VSSPRGAVGLGHAACAIAVVCALVHAGELDGPFVFDDQQSIVDNATLRAPLSLRVLSPPRETPVAGRPLANLTLGLDRARAGLEPSAFHLTNLVLHALVALLAFATLRRLFALAAMPEPVRARAAWLALATAVLFAAHPMTVELVLYATQRTESLVALCYLGAIYVLLRAHAEGSSRAWPAMAVVGVLGIASKEVFVTAPVMALCLDRAFLAGSFAGALRARAKLHAALAASWLPLLLLQKDDTRPESVRFAELDYVLAQAKLLPEYLATALVPSRPVFDYGPLIARSSAGAWPWLIAVGLIVAALAVFAFSHPRAGFLGVWVLGVLAPTSTLFSIHTEVGAERRFYLPLLSVLAVVVLLADVGLRRVAARVGRSVAVLGIGVFALAVALLSLQARAYAECFQDLETLWRYAVEARPENPRAHYNLAETFRRQGDEPGAELALRRAIALDPGYVDARVNLAGLLMARSRPQEALAQLEQAVRRARPGEVRARFNLGVTLGILGRMDEAARELTEVVRQAPDELEARLKLAVALRELGRLDEARAQLAWLEPRLPRDARVAALKRALAMQPPAP